MLKVLKGVAQISIPEDDLGIPKTGQPDDATIGIILEIVFGVAGVVAMLVIVIAGIQFMLSRGDPQKSAVARNAIIYAAIGLVLMTLAYSIVRFIAERVG